MLNVEGTAVRVRTGSGRLQLCAIRILEAVLLRKLSRLEVFLELGRRLRERIEKPLRLLTSFIDQERRLRLCFHPFGYDDKADLSYHSTSDSRWLVAPNLLHGGDDLGELVL